MRFPDVSDRTVKLKYSDCANITGEIDKKRAPWKKKTPHRHRQSPIKMTLLWRHIHRSQTK